MIPWAVSIEVLFKAQYALGTYLVDFYILWRPFSSGYYDNNGLRTINLCQPIHLVFVHLRKHAPYHILKAYYVLCMLFYASLYPMKLVAGVAIVIGHQF